MPNAIARLMLLCFLGLATGALQYVHESQDFAEDARQEAIEKAAAPGQSHPPHDEANCQVCASLHMALSAPGWVPLLICLGLFVAFLTQLSTPAPTRAATARIDCRGPPAF